MNKEKNPRNTGNLEPPWAKRARSISHKPNWADKVPQELWELGDVFFPIPRGVKGHNYPFSLEEYRFSATDEKLNAYLEAGWGYGITCANDLAVVDIDEMRLVDEIVSRLPPTLWQVSGSGEGVHLFYMVEGLNQRIMLYEDFIDQKLHVGEVKCDPHGYVVGPGSVHPSGNKYGPLQGNEIVSISQDELEDALEPWMRSEFERAKGNYQHGSYEPPSDEDVYGSGDRRHEFFDLDADDVLPWLEPGTRVSHPVHGSSTGSNFKKNEDGETFTCWRCTYGAGSGCGLNAQQLLCLRELADNKEYSEVECDELRLRWQDEPQFTYVAWQRAVKEQLIEPSPVPYRVLLGYALMRGVVDDSDGLSGERYWTAQAALDYEMRLAGYPK